jgi:hypothetical protein
MNSEALVRKWHKAIIADAESKLQRPLRSYEREFIVSRGGLIALEAIHDTIKAAVKDEAERYLGSEIKKAPAKDSR